MDKPSRALDFSRPTVARAPQLALERRSSRRAAAAEAGIPRFFLYGEPPHAAGERFVHVELIADRSSQNEWEVRPHTHSDLHQLFLILRGGGHVRADDRRCRLSAPLLILIPAGVVHAFSFQPATHGYVVTICD